MPHQEHLLKHIEQQSGNNFIRIGPPQPADLVRVCAKDALTKLASVHTDMLAVFEETAKEYLKDNGACSGLKPQACKCVGERVESTGECDGLIDVNDVVEGRQHMAVLAVVCTPAAHPSTVVFASLPSADPVSAMASALAVISGYTEGITAKSLLTSAEGYQTLLFKSDIPIKASQLVR